MKFGKEFTSHLEETLPEWRDKFLRYKPLKKLIKHHLPYDQPPQVVGTAPVPAAGIGVEEWFVRLLDEELEKFNDFYVDKEEEFIIRLQDLKDKIGKEKASRTGAERSENEFSEEMLNIRKAVVAIHGEMILLKNYSSLNFAGLVKIVKKYDKRTGGLLSLSFAQRALHQPFFTTEPLTRLVQECEANLELLFPQEPEVIEAETSGKPGTWRGQETTTCLVQEDNDEIYRSTLAAMRTIQGLRKASSTYNPLSLTQFFRQENGENESGAVTSPSSSDSPAALPTKQDADQDTVHSEN